MFIKRTRTEGNVRLHRSGGRSHRQRRTRENSCLTFSLKHSFDAMSRDKEQFYLQSRITCFAQGFARPAMTEDNAFAVEQGRHAVIDVIQSGQHCDTGVRAIIIVALEQGSSYQTTATSASTPTGSSLAPTWFIIPK